MSGTRLSGLQKDVLALYKKILREAVKKDRHESDGVLASPSVLSLLQNVQDGDANKHTSTAYARTEFRRQAAMVKRNDFKTIEYKIRKGEKHLKLLQMPGVKLVSGKS